MTTTSTSPARRRLATTATCVAAPALGLGLVPGAADAADGTVRVNPGYTLAAREAPSKSARKVRSLRDGQRVSIECQASGQRVTGRYGTSRLWNRLAGGGYVSDTYVFTGSDRRVAPRCAAGRPQPEPNPSPDPAPPEGFEKDPKRAPDAARYDDAAAWAGGANCTGGFTRGAQRLGDWLRANYRGTAPGSAGIQGYSCRQNTADLSKTSIHGVGRAVDWFRSAGRPAERGDADRFVARLRANRAALARAMGVQYVIWNGRQWSVRGTSMDPRPYGGPNPHTDHVHVELNVRGSRLRTSYWR